jgi:ribosomal protein S12 methylthiotransferase accessory factor YcaO
LKIVKPLQKVDVTEKDQVVMTCEVNKPNIKTKWFKDKQEVEPSENVHITTQENTHTLKITEVTLEDAGLYKCQMEDKYTQAKVYVKG